MKPLLLLSLIFGFSCCALAQEYLQPNGNFRTSGDLNGAQRNGINPQYNPGYSGGPTPGNGGINPQFSGGRNGIAGPGLSGGYAPGNEGQVPQLGGGRSPIPGNTDSYQPLRNGNGISNQGLGNRVNPGMDGEGLQFGGGTGRIPGNAGTFPSAGGTNGNYNQGLRNGINPGMGGRFQPQGSGNGNYNQGLRNGMNSGMGDRFQSLGSGNGINNQGLQNGMNPRMIGQGPQFNGGRGGIPGNTGNFQSLGSGNGINNQGFRNGINSAMGGQRLQDGGVHGDPRGFQFLEGANGNGNQELGRGVNPSMGGRDLQFGGGWGGIPGNAGKFQSLGNGNTNPGFNNRINPDIGGRTRQFDEGRGKIPGYSGNFQSLDGGNRNYNPGVGNRNIPYIENESPQFGRGMGATLENARGIQSFRGGSGLEGPSFGPNRQTGGGEGEEWFDRRRIGIPENTGLSEDESADFSDFKEINDANRPKQSSDFIDNSRAVSSDIGQLNKKKSRKSLLSETEFPDSSRLEKENFSNLKAMSGQGGDRIKKLKAIDSNREDSSRTEDEISSTTKTMSAFKKDSVQSLRRGDDSSDQCGIRNIKGHYDDEEDNIDDSGYDDSIKQIGNEDGESYKTLVAENDKRKVFRQRLYKFNDGGDITPSKIQDTDPSPDSLSSNDLKNVRKLSEKTSESTMDIRKNSDELSETDEDASINSEDESGTGGNLEMISATSPEVPDGNIETFTTDSRNLNSGKMQGLSEIDKHNYYFGDDDRDTDDETAILKKTSGAFAAGNSEFSNSGKVIGYKERLNDQRLREPDLRKEKGASIEGMGFSKGQDNSLPRLNRGERPDRRARNRGGRILQRQLNAGTRRWENFGMSNTADIASQGSPEELYEDSAYSGAGSKAGTESYVSYSSYGRPLGMNKNRRPSLGLYQNRNDLNKRIDNMNSGIDRNDDKVSAGNLDKNIPDFEPDKAFRNTGNDFGGLYTEDSIMPNARGMRAFGSNFGMQQGNSIPFGFPENGNTASMGSFENRFNNPVRGWSVGEVSSNIGNERNFGDLGRTNDFSRFNNEGIPNGGKPFGAANVGQEEIQIPFRREWDISGKRIPEDDLPTGRQGMDLSASERGRLNRVRSSFSGIQESGPGRKVYGKFQDKQRAFPGDASGRELDGKLRGATDRQRAFLGDASGRELDGKLRGATDRQRASLDGASGRELDEKLRGATDRQRASLDGASGRELDGKLRGATDRQRAFLGDASGREFDGKLRGATDRQRASLDGASGRELDEKLRGATDRQRASLDGASGHELDGKLRGATDRQRAFLDDASGRVSGESLQKATNGGGLDAGRFSEAREGAGNKLRGATNMGQSIPNDASGQASGKLSSESDNQGSNVGGGTEGAGRARLDVADKQRSDFDVTGRTEASNQSTGTSNEGSSMSGSVEGAL